TYYQIIYTPEEVGLTPGAPKWITGFSLRPVNTGSSYTIDPRVYMTQTSSSSSPNTNSTSYYKYNQLQRVFDSKATVRIYPGEPTYAYNSSTKWWDFPFESYFYWDGQSNLVFGFYSGQSNSSSYSHPSFYFHTSPSENYKTIGMYGAGNYTYAGPNCMPWLESFAYYSTSYSTNGAGLSYAPDLRVRVLECSDWCPAVTSISAVPDSITKTSAFVTWTENGTATAWEVQYGLYGTTNYTTIYTTDTNVKLEGLYTGMSYQVNVRAICYAGDTSNVATGYFTTLCQDTMDLPYSEDFNGSYGTSLLEHCWDDGTLSGQNDKPTITSDAITFPACTTAAYAISPAFRTNSIGGMY
ncbi:MAG TPA: hypothetical protein PLZ46_07560, partial [Bacteroidales bacterium]|nr:hypothetical protein [Bacteroidales bacterium]